MLLLFSTRWLWNVHWLLYRFGPLALCPIGQPSIYTEASGRTGHRGISDVFEDHSSDGCVLFNPISFRVAPPLHNDRVNGQFCPFTLSEAVLLTLALWPLLSLWQRTELSLWDGDRFFYFYLLIYLFINFSGRITSFHVVLCHIQRNRILLCVLPFPGSFWFSCAQTDAKLAKCSTWWLLSSCWNGCSQAIGSPPST